MTASPASPLIDVHTHPTLSSWEQAYDALDLPRVDGRPTQENIRLPEWSPTMFLDAMRLHGIQAMVMSWPPGTSIVRGTAARDLARAMNEEMAGYIRRYPARFGGFAVVPTDDMGAAAEEAVYATEVLGLEGICLPTNIDGLYLGEDRFAELFAECDRRRITVFVHPVTPRFFADIPLPYGPSVMEYMFETTRMLTSLVYSGRRSQYPNFPLIATHAGGVMPFISWRLATTANFLGVGGGKKMDPEEVWVGLKSFHFDLTTAPAAPSLASILQLVPATQLMMGTDCPTRPQPNITMALDELASSSLVNSEQRRQIRAGTAMRLFPRLAAAVDNELRRDGNARASKADPVPASPMESHR